MTSSLGIEHFELEIPERVEKLSWFGGMSSITGYANH